jgi:RnfABCDGE-type electron transport complex B subunit|tara:strand:+ start:3600 stop:4199 length:600 start_codon:yes stop_codon:yes gene_type:complete
MQYAQAIVDGDPHDRCVPGGQETLDKLNSILDKKISKVNLDYGPTIDNQKVSIVESECIGCKKCIDACPVDAIVGSANMMHSIIDDLCTGCELCIEPCPVDCIEIVSVSNDEIKAPRDISQSAYDIKESLSNNKRSKIKNFSDINLNISSDINTQITNRAINKAKKLEDMQITITKSDLKSLHDFDESLIGDFIKDRSD